MSKNGSNLFFIYVLDLGFSKNNLLRQLLTAMLVLTVLTSYAFIITILAKLRGASFEEILGGKIDDIRVLAIHFVFQIFFVGFGEEILFRGYFLDRIFFISSSKKFSAIATSILFGLVHYWSNGSITQVVSTSIIGFIFAYARLRFENCSIIAVSLAHGFYNFIFILIRFLFL